MRDPNPMSTGPTKWRAEHCTTHHHACDCREWEHACKIERLEAALEAAREDAERIKRDISELCDVMPMLPITAETMDAATDWFKRYCIDFHREIYAAREARNG